MDKLLQRAMDYVDKGILPVDRHNILFFLKIQAITLVAAIGIFTIGLIAGYHLAEAASHSSVVSTQTK